MRAGLLIGASLWSAWLAWQVAGLTAGGWRRAGATACIAAAATLSGFRLGATVLDLVGRSHRPPATSKEISA